MADFHVLGFYVVGVTFVVLVLHWRDLRRWWRGEPPLSPMELLKEDYPDIAEALQRALEEQQDG